MCSPASTMAEDAVNAWMEKPSGEVVNDSRKAFGDSILKLDKSTQLKFLIEGLNLLKLKEEERSKW